jgi:hypothetical protein
MDPLTVLDPRQVLQDAPGVLLQAQPQKHFDQGGAGLFLVGPGLRALVGGLVRVLEADRVEVWLGAGL